MLYTNGSPFISISLPRKQSSKPNTQHIPTEISRNKSVSKEPQRMGFCVLCNQKQLMAQDLLAGIYRTFRTKYPSTFNRGVLCERCLLKGEPKPTTTCTLVCKPKTKQTCWLGADATHFSYAFETRRCLQREPQPSIRPLRAFLQNAGSKGFCFS